MKIRCLGMMATGFVLAAWNAPAGAADSSDSAASAAGSDTNLEEIVVQARRRDEKLIDVPVALTVLSATQMEDAGIKNILDVGQYTPGLVVAEGVNDSTVRFFVRGK